MISEAVLSEIVMSMLSPRKQQNHYNLMSVCIIQMMIPKLKLCMPRDPAR